MENQIPDFYKAETLLNIMTASVTGGNKQETEFRNLRQYFCQSQYKTFLPQWFNGIWTLDLLWSYIKPKFNTYSERRKFLGDEFSPLLNACQGNLNTLSLQDDIIKDFSSIGLNECWQKMLLRVEHDPSGAITMARTTTETVLKHLADKFGETYDNETLPVLYKKIASKLNLSPNQHNEELFKKILGGCSSIADGLGNIRNVYGDAHGQGEKQIKPAIRHARLAVNAAATLCIFLIETYDHNSTITQSKTLK